MSNIELAVLIATSFWVLISFVQMIMIFSLIKSIGLLKNLLYVSQKMEQFDEGFENAKTR